MKEAIEKFLQTLRRTEGMPMAQMQAYQRGLLERLLRYARANVPFYRETRRLEPLFAPDDTVDWSRWHEIPRLTRKELQQNFDALSSQNLPPEHGRTSEKFTSGTTDEPVRILHSELSERIAWSAVTLRDFEAHGIDPTRHLAYLYQFAAEQFASGQAGEHQEWYAGFASLGFPGKRTDLNDTDPVKDIIAAVVAMKPDYLRVQPVALELMCEHDEAAQLPGINLSGVMCVGERFEDGAKTQIEQYLGCKIMEVYGSNECGRMATTCVECGRYHIHSETALIEVVDDNGSLTAPGDTGWVLATPLYNYAMPLIRYEHVDEARVGLPDQCRIKRPALDAIYGKRRTPFVFPDGTAIRPTLPLKMVVRYLGAESFQFAQVAPDRCEIKFVPGSIKPADMQFDEMTKYLRSIWWPGLNVDYQMVGTLPRKARHSKTAQFG